MKFLCVMTLCTGIACSSDSPTADPEPVAAVSISPAGATLQLGASQTFIATLRDAAGRALSGRSVAWSSSSEAVATVTSAGVVTTHAAGSAAISAESESRSASVTVTVPTVTSVSIVGASTVFIGTDVQLTAVAKDALGTTLTNRQVAWSSTNLSVATVSPGGSVHGIVAGNTTITASVEGKTATLDVTVRAAPPSARWLHGMTYDEARGQLLMFGGSTNVLFFNDLWTWNGTEWVQIPTPNAPPPRDGMIFTYDATRQVVVMFGGRNGQATLTDTWEWNGSVWTQRATTGPAARQHFGGGYDRARARTVVYGGNSASGTPLTDTWEWDGTSWTSRSAVRPDALDAPGRAVFDADRNALVMLVGSFTAGPTELWQWNGTSWTVIGSGPAPTSPEMIESIAPSSIILVESSGNGATWRWNGVTWSNLGIAGPGRRFAPSMALDQARNQLVFFGGYDGVNFLADTWTFAGGTWTHRP